MNFIFGGKFGEREAVKLGGTMPYIHPDARRRVHDALQLGCYCRHDGDRTASLRRRVTAGGSVGVWLQCDACGSSLGNAMSKQAHPHWQDYPVWDSEKAKQYDAANVAWRATLPSYEDQKAAQEAAYAQRSREYDEWCRTSPEWKEIARFVAWRSRGHCEACLSGSAEVVHHVTYAFGKLPPAWHLRAVCRTCHDRLHSRGDDWCDWGMGR